MEIKEQLKEDEKLLVSVFKLEKLFNKYKKHLIIGAVGIVVFIAGVEIKDYMHTQMLIKTNKALDELLENPNNKKAFNILKENKELFNLYLFHIAKSVEDFNKIDSDNLYSLKNYKIAMLKGDKKSLENYLLDPKNDILKDSVRVALIRIYLSEGNREKAKELFSQINNNSKFYQIAQMLMHYGIVK